MHFTRELLRCTAALLVDMHRAQEALPLLEHEMRLAEATPSDGPRTPQQHFHKIERARGLG